MSQYRLYMQNPFWQEMSNIAFDEKRQIDSRYYDQTHKDGRYTPQFIYGGIDYTLQNKRSWQGPSSYIASLPNPDIYEHPRQTLHDLQTCTRNTGNPHACARGSITEFRCCNGR